METSLPHPRPGPEENHGSVRDLKKEHFVPKVMGSCRIANLEGEVIRLARPTPLRVV